MTEQHPITPPEQLLSTWRERQFYAEENINVLLTAAYQAGADHELEACCEWLEARINEGWNLCHLKDLRNTRRPKLPSLKEQALSEVAAAVAGGNITPERGAKIRLALEQLND